MRYFVTGATGFIGKRLVKALLARRGATVHFLLRPESEAKIGQERHTDLFNVRARFFASSKLRPALPSTSGRPGRVTRRGRLEAPLVGATGRMRAARARRVA